MTDLTHERAAKRNELLLAAAVAASRKFGWRTVTRDQIAAEAGLAAGSVNHGYGTVEALREATMRHAVECEILDIVAQGLAVHSPIAQAASPDLKARALAALAS